MPALVRGMGTPPGSYGPRCNTCGEDARRRRSASPARLDDHGTSPEDLSYLGRDGGLATLQTKQMVQARWKLSAEEKRTFHEGGVVIRRGLYRDDEVGVARAALERLYRTAQTLRATGDHGGAFFALGLPPEGGAVVVQRVVWAGGAEPVLLRLSEDARLVEPALDLLGTRQCEQLLCPAHYKMPNDGVAFDWHQDIQHRDKGGDTWRDVTGLGSFVQTVLLVDDMTEVNGPLEFLPREAATLDAAGRLVKDGGPVQVDTSRAVSVTGRAGDVLLFGPYAVHGSTPNASSSPRRVLINGYAAPGANRRFYPGHGACRVLPVPGAHHAPAAPDADDADAAAQ